MSSTYLKSLACFGLGVVTGGLILKLLRDNECKRGARVTTASNPEIGDGSLDQADEALRLVRKAEFVLRRRTNRITAVLENCTDEINHVAVMRTCEALGIQNVWLVEAPLSRVDTVNKPRWMRRAEKNDPNYDPLLGTKRASIYKSHLDVKVFKTTGECITALREVPH